MIGPHASEVLENIPTCFSYFSFKLNQVEITIKKPALVARDIISIDQVVVYSATLNHIFLTNSKRRQLARSAATYSPSGDDFM